MTGFPDDRPGGVPDGPGAPRVPDGTGSPGGPGGPGAAGSPEVPGSLDGAGSPDPLEPLLRHPAPFLPAPPGSFERIRRKAARRRRARAAVGGSAAVAVIAGAFYLAGSLHTGGGDEVVGPPASSLRSTSAPAPTRTTTAPQAPESGTTGSPQTRPTPLAPAPTTTAGPTSTGSTPSAGATAPPAGTPMCTAGQLSAELSGGDAGAGNLYSYLVFTNTSKTACHLAGFPGLSLLDADGKQIGDPATREPVDYSVVVLKPGGNASDTVHTINHQGTCLPTSAQVRVYPPGSRASLVFPGQLTNCDNLLAITPLTAGRTGNPPS
ncbi:DUF4232 domain-containing protein [Streptomyces sp. NBC_01476]|uniref:DUF4232 domain-containing protein n=1 Tax=Streptomyces sp. NBC_01476 TaxID=2903881 RepID=UPI002E341491|nr:DUF4232 domain-containing protein [Streptomyces sp. NBC_01476]